MKIENIGVMSPGDMGQAIAGQLMTKGFNVCTALDGRSARTRALAQQAGLTDVGSLGKLTETCDVIISIMNPGAALGFATQIAQILSAGSRKLLFVDCNALGPATMQKIASVIAGAGSRCVDGSIMSPPPRNSAKAVIYLSGEAASELEQLATPQMRTHVLSTRVGDASALRICYSVMYKGMMAMGMEALIAARRLGVDGALANQIRENHPALYDETIALLPKMPGKAYRCVPEMLEAAQTFQALGLPTKIFQGAAETYEFITNRLDRKAPENCNASAMDIVGLLAGNGHTARRK